MPDKLSALVLEGYDFWTDISVSEFQKKYRLPAEYAPELLLDHLHLARVWSVRQLKGWHFEQLRAGYSKISEVPLSGLPGGAELTWKRAVFCHAKALLLPQFATVDRREAAKNEARESPETAAIFFAQANDAIADLVGRGRIMVGLV